MNSVNVLTKEKLVVSEGEGKATPAKKTTAAVKKSIAKAVKVEKENMKENAVEKNLEEASKNEAVKKAVKKETVKKETTKKTAAKKTSVTKESTSKKEEVMGATKEEIFIQTSSNEMRLEAIIEKVKKAYVAEGNVETKDDQIRIYIKPEENMVYYVVNNSYASGINLFDF